MFDRNRWLLGSCRLRWLLVQEPRQYVHVGVPDEVSCHCAEHGCCSVRCRYQLLHVQWLRTAQTHEKWNQKHRFPKIKNKTKRKTITYSRNLKRVISCFLIIVGIQSCIQLTTIYSSIPQRFSFSSLMDGWNWRSNECTNFF